jgi:hypothetical protein
MKLRTRVSAIMPKIGVTLRLRRMGTSLVVLAAALACSSCGSNSASRPVVLPPPGGGPSATVVVTPSTITLLRGETVHFTAKVSGPSDQSVIWSAPTGFGTIDATGLYTAPTNLDGGSVNVTATSNAIPAASGTATVNLPKVTFSISPDAVAIMPGASSTFTVTVDGLNTSNVVWTVQGTAAGTINTAGVYTAPSVKGLYYVDATSTANAHYRATALALVAPTTTSFSPTGDTKKRHALHTATLLPNGKVLLAGGYVYEAYCIAGIDSTELYDPALGSFSSTNNIAIRRYAQTATRLANGDVLIAGGFTYDQPLCSQLEPSPAVSHHKRALAGPFVFSPSERRQVAVIP